MTANTLANLSVTQLKKVITIREKIEKLEKELSELLGEETEVKTKPAKKGSRGITPEGRARIAAAQKERWAKQRKAKAAKSKPAKAQKGRAPAKAKPESDAA
ncbi:MAG TPA: hypothetical protein P5055_14240, partial [Candidatus Paceibacterota bacterium]|nr:hypothetical protein [Candidatus Paceibacterota bacterium]